MLPLDMPVVCTKAAFAASRRFPPTAAYDAASGRVCPTAAFAAS